MVQINQDSKRFRTAMRFFTYGVMTMAVIALSTLVILLSLGYRFDKGLNIVREGLVQLGDRPVDAKYSINGKEYSDTTPAKATLPAGDYSIVLHQDGYRSWQKQVTVIAGRVHWVNYARLIPNQLSPQTVKQFGKVNFAQVSPDKRWIIADVSAEEKNQLELIDLKDPQKPEFTAFTIPKSELTEKDGALGSISFVEWSLDSKYLLLKHTNGDTTEYLRVERAKATNTTNLSKRFQLSLADVHLSGGNASVIFARTGGTLRRIDLGGNTVSGPLLDNVRSYEVFGDDTIAYARTAEDSDGKQALQVGLLVKDKNTVLNELPAGNDVSVGYKEYDHHSYFVIANRSTSQVKVLQDPLQESSQGQQVFIEFDNLRPHTVQFNPTGRFLMVRDGANVGIYDFYEQQKHTFALEGITNDIPLKWLDEFRIAAAQNSQLTMWDFDGTNKQTLVSHTTLPSVGPVLDEDDDILYTFFQPDAQKNAFQFQSTSLKAK